MKKSELKEIIREEIQLVIEQQKDWRPIIKRWIKAIETEFGDEYGYNWILGGNKIGRDTDEPTKIYSNKDISINIHKKKADGEKIAKWLRDVKKKDAKYLKTDGRIIIKNVAR